MNRCIALAASVVLLTVAIPIDARSQSLSISGIVLDQSGATIPDALITLKKGEETRTAQTGAAGSFNFAGVGGSTKIQLVLSRYGKHHLDNARIAASESM